MAKIHARSRGSFSPRKSSLRPRFRANAFFQGLRFLFVEQLAYKIKRRFCSDFSRLDALQYLVDVPYLFHGFVPLSFSVLPKYSSC